MTPLPGIELEEAEARQVFDRFMVAFRNDEPVECTPAHYQFKVTIEPLFWGTLFDQRWIPDAQNVLFMEETPIMQQFPQEIRRATMAEVRAYYIRRKPWEFADCYIISPAFDWCVAITHDDLCLACGDIPQLPYAEQDA